VKNPGARSSSPTLFRKSAFCLFLFCCFLVGVISADTISDSKTPYKSLTDALNDLKKDSATQQGFAQAIQDTLAENAVDDGDTPTSQEEVQDHYLAEPVTITKFDRNKWNVAKKGLDYNEQPPPKPLKWNPWFTGSSIFSGEAVKFVLFSIVILLLAFVLFKIFSGRLGNKRIRKDEHISNIEDIEDIAAVPESELDRLLREALERKDFKEAIRISYLFIIRSLSEQELIHWKKDKTNREYLTELNKSIYYNVFREVTAVFDRVWYGDIELGEIDYLRISPHFKNLGDLLKTNNTLEK